MQWLNIRVALWLALAALLVQACAAAPTASIALNNPPPDPAAATVVGHTPGPPATETPTPLPSTTPTPTMHPMMIEAMRQLDYPGSDLTIERELDSGANYRRYYVSYLSEGLKIYALLTVPFAEMPPGGYPAIIFNHGYIPPEQYRTTERYIAYVDNLARNGYIVLRPDYRGHDQSEGEARGAYGSPDYVIDVLNGVASIKRFPQANPNRIGMWGHSMGGYITLRSMVISPDIKAGVIWAGVVAPYPDPFARGTLRPTPTGTFTPSPFGRGWRWYWIDQYGTPKENPQFWNGISANSYLDDISGPVQLHHGTADDSVPLAASQTLYEQMLAAGKTVEFYTYENDNHNLSGFFTLAMTRTIEFFDSTLKP